MSNLKAAGNSRLRNVALCKDVLDIIHFLHVIICIMLSIFLFATIEVEYSM